MQKFDHLVHQNETKWQHMCTVIKSIVFFALVDYYKNTGTAEEQLRHQNNKPVST